jgi:hypothetical protein
MLKSYVNPEESQEANRKLPRLMVEQDGEDLHEARR